MGENKKSIETKFQELEDEYRQVPKRKKIFRLATLAFLIFIWVLSSIIKVTREAGLNRAHADYLSSENVDALSAYFDNDAIRGDSEAMARLEEYTIGIPNNIALCGISWSCDANTDYKNEIGDVLAWRDVKTGELVVSVNNEQMKWGNIVVGELIATEEIIYYIKEEDSLLYKHFINGEEYVVYPNPLQSFAIVGDQIFMLDKGGSVLRYDTDDDKVDHVVSNVQRFFVSGDLIVQNGLQIYSVGLDGKDKNLLVENVLLAGADAQKIYFTDFGLSDSKLLAELSNDSATNGFDDEIDNPNNMETMELDGSLLYAMDLETKEIEPIEVINGFIRAVYSTAEGIVIDTVN